MYPTTGGVIRSEIDVVPAEVTVTTSAFNAETTVHVQRWAGEWREAYVVLSEDRRRELIELLGGTA